MRKLARLRAVNIYDALWVMPRRVYINAPGPWGVEHYKDIPEDAYVVAVNKGVEIPWTCSLEARFSNAVWVVSDWHATKKHYFKPSDARFDGIRVFSVRAASKTPSFTQPAPGKHFFFDMAAVERDIPFRPAKRKFRPGGTVAGCALWLCYLCGAKEIILNGVDMSGNRYYDGSENPTERWLHKHGDIWTSRNAMDGKIEWMQQRGVRVFTLSKTQLRKPERNIDYA
jgi:hypothetical protein